MSPLLHNIIAVAINGLSIYLVAVFLPGMKAKSLKDALWFALVVAILQHIAWVTLGALFVTFSVLTLGIGYFLVSGAIFLVAQKVASGVEIRGCLPAIIAAVLTSFVSSGIHSFLKFR